MKTLANRLALIFLLITLGVIAIVYVGVVPNLRSSLVDERGNSLRGAARRDAPAIARAITGGVTQRELDQVVRSAADQANARVTLLSVGAEAASARGRSCARTPTPAPTSATSTSRPPSEAVQARRPATGTEAVRGGRVVQAARPLFFRDDESGDRTLGVRRRLLRAARRRRAQRRPRALADHHRRGRRARPRGARRVPRRAVARAAAWRAFSTSPSASRSATSRPASRSRATTSSASSRRRSTRCSASSPALDSSRRRFIATASHELRTPVFSLGGFLELLEDEDLDEETRARFLDQVRDQTDAAAQADDRPAGPLAAGRRVGRAAARGHGHRRSRADGRPRSSLPALDEHESNLSLTPAGEPMNVVCDPDRVAQIMRILIDNAITHTPPGTAVAVSTSRDERGVTIAVTDSGLRRPACRAAARLRALLHVRRNARIGARPDDRARPRGAAWAAS